EKNKFSFSPKQKIILLCAAFAAFVLLVLSQHLTWDCVGEGIVDTVQGRYFIPIFPILFLMFTNTREKLKSHLQPLFLVYWIFLSVFSLYIIYKRYYIESYVEKMEFTCDLEQIDTNGQFKTTQNGITLDGVIARDSSTARSGKYSEQMNENV